MKNLTSGISNTAVNMVGQTLLKKDECCVCACVCVCVCMCLQANQIILG